MSGTPLCRAELRTAVTGEEIDLALTGRGTAPRLWPWSGLWRRQARRGRGARPRLDAHSGCDRNRGVPGVDHFRSEPLRPAPSFMRGRETAFRAFFRAGNLVLLAAQRNVFRIVGA